LRVECTCKLQQNELDDFGNKLDKKKDKWLEVNVTLKVTNWNVRGIGAKETELDKECKEKKINSAVITETKKKLKGREDLENYVMIYSGVEQKKRVSYGVAIFVNEKWKNKTVSCTL
jgi:hypothetical protein